MRPRLPEAHTLDCILWGRWGEHGNGHSIWIGSFDCTIIGFGVGVFILLWALRLRVWVEVGGPCIVRVRGIPLFRVMGNFGGRGKHDIDIIYQAESSL